MDYRLMGKKFAIGHHINTIVLLLHCQQFEEQEHPRYPPKTYKNGENVGGRFRGKDSGSKKRGDARNMPSDIIDDILPDVDLGFIDIEGAWKQIKEVVSGTQEELDKKLGNAREMKVAANAVFQEFQSAQKTVSPSQGLPDVLQSIARLVKKAGEEALLDPVGVAIGGAGMAASLLFTTLQFAGVGSVATIGKNLASKLITNNKWASFLIGAGSGLTSEALILGSSVFALRKAHDVANAYRVSDYQSTKLKEINKKEDRKSARSAQEITESLSPHFEEETGISKKKIKAHFQDKYWKGFLSEQERLLANRVTELNDLVEKNKANTSAARWREGVVKAELKYGSNIDRLISTPVTGVDRVDESQYNKFLGTIQKKSSPTLESRYLQEGELSMPDAPGPGERKDITIPGTGTININTVDFWTSDDFESGEGLDVKERLERVREHAKDIDKLSNIPDLDVSLTATNPDPPYTAHEITPFFTQIQVNFKTKDIISMGKERGFGNENPLSAFAHFQQRVADDRTLLFHEMGHAIEANGGLQEESYDIIQERTKTSSSPFYTGPYTQRMYGVPGETPTELVSMGTQQLAHPLTAKLFAARDREHFLYTLHALDQEG